METSLDDIASGKREYVKHSRFLYAIPQRNKSKDKLAKATNMGDAPGRPALS